MSQDDRILRVRKLSKSFGGLQALDDVDLDVRHREILGIIGPNGAGKSTLFNVLTGIYRPNSGTIEFRGKNITGLPLHRIARLGIRRVFQDTHLFHGQTVFENVVRGLHLLAKASFWEAFLNTPSAREDEATVCARALEVIEFLGLLPLKDEAARNLPYGLQRVLGLAIALSAKPALLLLDEPMTGLNDEETRTLMQRVREIRDSGVTVCLVEHNMDAVMGLCDRIAVLNYGRKIAEGGPDQITKNREVVEAYLGS